MGIMRLKSHAYPTPTSSFFLSIERSLFSNISTTWSLNLLLFKWLYLTNCLLYLFIFLLLFFKLRLSCDLATFNLLALEFKFLLVYYYEVSRVLGDVMLWVRGETTRDVGVRFAWTFDVSFCFWLIRTGWSEDIYLAVLELFKGGDKTLLFNF